MKTVLLGVLAVISVIMIIAIMLQKGSADGLSAVSGGSDSIYGKKKSNGIDEKLNKVTIAIAVLFLVVNLIILIIE